ncbi:EKC/KEOPS complex subunit LAGE3-like [Vicugna pacos]|uniref:L antigen family member 3 n=1 Tax=Vicugna pacos TaxID=30538 RepID=A0A6J0B621_VICPA|nr:cancer/testis antigen 1-like [Vicugna pacos]
MGSDADGGGAVRAADAGAGAAVVAVEAAGGGQGAPGGPGDLGGPGEPIHPGDPGDPGDLDGPGAPGGPGVAGEADGAAGGIPQIERAPQAAGPGGDAAPTAGGPGNQLLQFFFTVPFPSPVEAEIAHWFLTPNVELQGPVQEEFSVNGSVLAVRLTAEDPGQLRTSIASCLDQLFLVMQAMQCFVPPSFAQPQQGKGG